MQERKAHLLYQSLLQNTYVCLTGNKKHVPHVLFCLSVCLQTNCLFVLLLFQEQLQHYSQLYNLSRSERSKVCELAVTMATDGQPLGLIGELLHVAVGPLDLSVKSVVRDAVEKVVVALRYCLSPSFIQHFFFFFGLSSLIVVQKHKHMRSKTWRIQALKLLARSNAI